MGLDVGRALHNVTVRSGPVKFRSALEDEGHVHQDAAKNGAPTGIVCTIHAADDQSMKLVVR